VKVGYLITARLKSTRLPEKLLREVCGRPILAHMLDRLNLAERVDAVIICTSTNPGDDRLVDLAESEGVGCFRGDEDDVLKRLYDAALAYELDYVLNITADCPFVDPVYADRIVEAFERTDADLIHALDLPHGAYSYGIKPAALETVLDIKENRDTEVWGRYFTDTDLFDVYDLPIEDELHRQPDLRMTLDYPEDLSFFRVVFAELYQPGEVFSLDEILRFLDEHPEVVDINRHCEEAYERRWRRQSEIVLKSRYPVERAAIFGCGSIGQRHIRNLRELGITDIVALRSRKGHFKALDPALGVREVQNWGDLLECEPDVAIVSNPTSCHLDTALRLVPHVRGLFIEKPLATSLAGVETLLQEVEAHNVVSFVGYNLQFHPVVEQMQELLAGGKLGAPLLLQCQVGQWLPDWHPYEDYREAYYARSDLGGGAALTLIHEVHLAVALLGAPCAVSCFVSESELLTLEVDVIADIMVQHASGGVSQIHLDFIQRPLHRCGVVSCERGWIAYDLVTPKVVVRADGESGRKTAWEDADFDGNRPYVDEMRTFLRYVREGRVRHTFDVQHASQSLGVVDAAFASADEERLQKIPESTVELV
jgi:predicted dehydrogenase/spore coat polysaccharide biosynthesis protein SpsF (cytidylyltransferase family)